MQISSVASVLTAAFALVISGLNLQMSRDGQITTRYSDAVEQLGSRELITRTGAVHALSRLAVNSDHDRPAIIDLLADYIRASISIYPGESDRCYARGAPPMDVVAALKALFYKLPAKLREDRVDLRSICLSGVEFPYADMTCMRLDNAIIGSSRFDHATLVDASLQHADLRGNFFTDADFTRAVALNARFGASSEMPSADTTKIEMPSADMTNAKLRDADLAAAALVDVDLSGANLTRAKLTGADLTGSETDGAVLATYLDDAKSLPLGVDRSRALDKPPAPASRRCPQRRELPRSLGRASMPGEPIPERTSH